MIASAGLLFASLGLSGCATMRSLTEASPYQPVTSRTLNGGYYETSLAPDRARVVFVGNSWTPRVRAEDFALLRAAELSIQAGFPFFAVTKEHTDVETDTADNLTLSMPRSEILVQFLKNNQPGDLVFNAADLAALIRGKYHIR
jgi:hypothetical protein